MLAAVHRAYPQARLTGLDLSEHALAITAARTTGATLVHGRTDALPLGDSEFDVVLSLDVLVSKGVDDRAALRELHRVLQPGGKLIVNLAAFDFLKGSHDTAVNMARRYTRPKLTALLRETGFSVERITYWNMTLLPFIAVVRWMTRTRMNEPDVRSDLAPLPAPVNAILRTLAEMELSLSRIVPLPFGTSVFAIASK
jgi:ubiquinone/menaquinone biosynthesis C-methylase UbiE